MNRRQFLAKALGGIVAAVAAPLIPSLPLPKPKLKPPPVKELERIVFKIPFMSPDMKEIERIMIDEASKRVSEFVELQILHRNEAALRMVSGKYRQPVVTSQDIALCQ